MYIFQNRSNLVHKIWFFERTSFFDRTYFFTYTKKWNKSLILFKQNRFSFLEPINVGLWPGKIPTRIKKSFWVHFRRMWWELHSNLLLIHSRKPNKPCYFVLIRISICINVPRQKWCSLVRNQNYILQISLNIIMSDVWLFLFGLSFCLLFLVKGV